MGINFIRAAYVRSNVEGFRSFNLLALCFAGTWIEGHTWYYK